MAFEDVYSAVPARLVYEASHFALRCETRPYLEGVHIHAAGSSARVVATDGHCLAVFDAPGAIVAEPCTIQTVRDAQRMLALLKKFAAKERALLEEKECLPARSKTRKAAQVKPLPGWVVVSHSRYTVQVIAAETAGGAIEIAKEGLTHPLCEGAFGRALIDMGFPAYQGIIPKTVYTGIHDGDAFSPDLLGRFSVLGGGLVLRPSSSGSYSPYLVLVEGRPEFVGVLMPIRAGRDAPGGLPSWLN